MNHCLSIDWLKGRSAGFTLVFVIKKSGGCCCFFFYKAFLWGCNGNIPTISNHHYGHMMGYTIDNLFFLEPFELPKFSQALIAVFQPGQRGGWPFPANHAL